MIEAWTDGSAAPTNPGPMRWAVVWVRDGEIVAEQTWDGEHGTNVRAEMLAVIHALEGSDEDLLVVSDAAVVVRCATKEWVRRANLDLWQRFDVAMKRRKGRKTGFRLVKGHAGHLFNERADQLAKRAQP